MKKQFGLLLVVAVLFFSCANQKQALFNFPGQTLQLVELNGVAYDSASTMVPLSLIFSEDGEEVSGLAGCNQIFGPYSVDKTNIKFSNLGMTRRLCDEVSNDVEAKFAEALEKTDNYKFMDGKLYFYNGDNLLASFIPCEQKPVDFNFSGKTLQLIELNGAAYDSTSTMAPVSLTFDQKKMEVSGSAGCNQIFGPYSVDKSNIKFSNLGMTRRLCDEVSNGVEKNFAEALNKTDNYKITDNKVYFYNGEALLAVFLLK